MAKNIIVPIVSDASKFLSGFEEVIQKLEKAANKANITDGMQTQFEQLSSSIKESQKQIDEMLDSLRTGAVHSSIFSDFQKETLETFSTIQNEINKLQKDTTKIQVDVNAENLTKFIANSLEQMQVLQRQAKEMKTVFNSMFAEVGKDSSLTSGVNTELIQDLKNKLIQANGAFESFDKTLQKDSSGKLSEGYKKAAQEVVKLAQKIFSLDEVYSDNVANYKSFLSDDEYESFSDMFANADPSTGWTTKQFDVLTDKANEWALSTISATQKVKSEVTEAVSAFTVKDGKIKVPVSLSDNTLSKLKKEIESIRLELEKFYNTNPIKIAVKTMRDASSEQTVVDSTTTEIMKISSSLTEMMSKQGQPINVKELEKMSESLKKILSSIDSLNKKFIEAASNGQKVVDVDFSSIEQQLKDLSSKMIGIIKSTVTQIDELLARGFNVASTQDLNNSWFGIETQFKSLISQTEKLDLRATKTKEKIKALFDAYKEYQNLGGKKTLSILHDGSVNSDKVLKQYPKYRDSDISVSVAAQESTQSTKQEAEGLKEVSTEAQEAANAKEQFVSANIALDESTNNSVDGIKNEEKALEQLGEQAEETQEDVAQAVQNADKAIDDIDNKAQQIREKLEGTTYVDQVNKLQTSAYNASTTRQGGKDLMAEVLQAYEELKGKVNSTSQELIEAEQKFQNAISKTKSDIARANTVKKEYFNPIKKQAWVKTVAEYMAKNTSASVKFKKELKQIHDLMLTTNDTDSFNGLVTRFTQLQREMTEAGEVGLSFFDKWKKRLENIGLYLSTFVGLYDVIRILKQGLTIIQEYDAAMTNLYKVAQGTRQEIDKFGQASYNIASEIGATNTAVIDAATEWSRLGYSIKEAAELSKASTIYVNVGEIDATTATTDLVSAMKAFDIEAENAMRVVDSMNEIGNNYAVSTAQLGEILKKSSASLAVSGDSIDQVIAMGAAMNEITQDASVTGTTLKMVGLRIRGASTEIEQMGESTDGMAESTSKLREKILALTNVDGTGGFDIMLDPNTFKTTYDILKGISTVWERMDQIDQAALLELIAGKNRAQGAAALIKNFEKAEQALVDSQNASGSALKENEAYMESIQGHLNVLQNKWNEVWGSVANREAINAIIDLGSGLLDIVNEVGVLQSLLIGGGGIFAAFKGNGRLKKSSLIFI